MAPQNTITTTSEDTRKPYYTDQREPNLNIQIKNSRTARPT